MTEIVKMFDFLSYLYQFLLECCPDKDSPYYGTLLIFASVSFSIVSVFISLTHSNYPKLVEDNKKNIKSEEDDIRGSGLEAMAAIEIYACKHTTIFFFVAFLFLLSAFFIIVYMFFNKLIFGKISFIIVMFSLSILLFLSLQILWSIIKITCIKKIKEFSKALKDAIDRVKSKT